MSPRSRARSHIQMQVKCSKRSEQRRPQLVLLMVRWCVNGNRFVNRETRPLTRTEPFHSFFSLIRFHCLILYSTFRTKNETKQWYGNHMDARNRFNVSVSPTEFAKESFARTKKPAVYNDDKNRWMAFWVHICRSAISMMQSNDYCSSL